MNPRGARAALLAGAMVLVTGCYPLGLTPAATSAPEPSEVADVREQLEQLPVEPPAPASRATTGRHSSRTGPARAMGAAPARWYSNATGRT
jgi:hypothetical protein